jgi:uncharacterized protein YkwD
MLGFPLPAARNPRRVALVSLLAILACSLVPASADARRSARLDSSEATRVKLINGLRAQHGLRALKVSHRLNRAANGHSWDMVVANYFSHTSRNGTSSSARVRRYKKAKKVGETLAYVPRSQRRGAAWRVARMWMDSPSHRAVLLEPGFRRLGVARQVGRMGGGSKKIVFTADFTSRR